MFRPFLAKERGGGGVVVVGGDRETLNRHSYQPASLPALIRHREGNGELKDSIYLFSVSDVPLHCSARVNKVKAINGEGAGIPGF